MTRMYWNKKTNRIYGWKASKNCVLVDDESEDDRKKLLQAGLLKPAKCNVCGNQFSKQEAIAGYKSCEHCEAKFCPHCNKQPNPNGGLGCYACESTNSEDVYTHSAWCKASTHCEAKEFKEHYAKRVAIEQEFKKVRTDPRGVKYTDVSEDRKYCVVSGCGSLLQRFPNGQLACPLHDRHILGEDVMGRKLKD